MSRVVPTSLSSLFKKATQNQFEVPGVVTKQPKTEDNKK